MGAHLSGHPQGWRGNSQLVLQLSEHVNTQKHSLLSWMGPGLSSHLRGTGIAFVALPVTVPDGSSCWAQICRCGSKFSHKAAHAIFEQIVLLINLSLCSVMVTGVLRNVRHWRRNGEQSRQPSQRGAGRLWGRENLGQSDSTVLTSGDESPEALGRGLWPGAGGAPEVQSPAGWAARGG